MKHRGKADLSQETREILRSSGWKEPCETYIQRYRHALIKEGYPVHECVMRFLASYGGLRVLLNPGESRKKRDDFRIDPMAAIDVICIERVREEYDLRVNGRLCVIGLYHWDHMVLMMDENGRMFAGYDDILLHMGDSGEDALGAICQGTGAFSKVSLLEEDALL